MMSELGALLGEFSQCALYFLHGIHVWAKAGSKGEGQR